MGDEIWKPVPGYGGHYEASSHGRIRVKDRIVSRKHSSGKMVDFFYKGRLLKPYDKDGAGHLSVTLGVDNQYFSLAVHRLVLFAFVGECPEGMEGCHNNGVAHDNRIENLRWDTHLNNNRDRLKHGTYLRGENHKMARLSEDLVKEIISSGLHYEEAAKKYGISRTHAHGLLRGDRWKHLTGSDSA